MKILLIEPWLTGSHQAWAEGYQRCSSHDVRIASLPGERWRWRLRGGAVELLAPIQTALVDGWVPDLLLVSGLVDVAVLAGFLRRSLEGCAIAVYQHESQMLYPTPDGAVDIDAVMHNVNSWLVADAVIFNSEFHRSSVDSQLADFASSLHSQPLTQLLASLDERVSVLHVGVELGWTERRATRVASPAPQILWPHRWDSDKRPDVFLRAIERLRDAELEFTLVLAGEDGGESGIRREIVDRFGGKVVAEGPFEVSRYRELVVASDIVVSCAEHEFFGVAVVEALAAGCWGVLPAALSYPELVGPGGSAMLYRPTTFGTALESAVRQHARRQLVGHPLGAEVRERFDWDRLGARYDRKLAAIESATVQLR